MKTEKIISDWANGLILTQEQKTETEKKKLLKKLAEILKKQKKGYLLPAILKMAEKLSRKKKIIELIFSREQKQELASKIKDRLIGIFGKEKEVEVKTEEQLIGGFRVKTGNTLIKASIKDFLDELRER